VTGYYGALTRKAVQAFQVKYGVAKPGDAGYGIVGPKTRAALQKAFAK
jgi:peptidoglycan hydrolase-like protein with peptidoglycan-binding domain